MLRDVYRGITPEPWLVTAALNELSIPLYAMIRPRGGNLVFSSDESATMCRQIESAKSAGAHGVVLEIQLPEGHVDTVRTRARCLNWRGRCR